MELSEIDCKLISYDGNNFIYDKQPFEFIMKKVYCTFLQNHNIEMNLSHMFPFHTTYLDKLDEIYQRINELSWHPVELYNRDYVLYGYYDKDTFQYRYMDSLDKPYPLPNRIPRKEMYILVNMSYPLIIDYCCGKKLIPRMMILNGIINDLIKF